MNKQTRQGQTKKPAPRSPGRKPHKTAARETCFYEAVAAEGLEFIARRELNARLGQLVTLHRTPESGGEPGVVHFRSTSSLYPLLHLKTVQAIYLIRRYAVPRPRALLGDEHFRALLGDIEQVRAVHPPGAFQTFFISAAGGESAVLKRLKSALAEATGLREGLEEGDLLLRLRRPPGNQTSWEVLIRLSPRPLATRSWRVCNREGALNAAVAHAMTLMTDPMPRDVFLNLGCGSGTLLIERLSAMPARRAIGCDSDPQALACARQNIEAAGCIDAAELYDWDMRRLPLPDASVDALCADLPFGHLVGSHEDNLILYPVVLAEAARVAKPGALFALITHEVRLMQRLLGDTHQWQKVTEQRIALGGLYPHIFVLARSGASIAPGRATIAYSPVR